MGLLGWAAVPGPQILHDSGPAPPTAPREALMMRWETYDVRNSKNTGMGGWHSPGQACF